MSIKPDDIFVATATDPARRSAAIADLTQKHRMLFCASIFIALVFLGISYFGSRQPDAIFILIVILPLIQLHKCESELKLLRVIDRLQGNGRPVA